MARGKALYIADTGCANCHGSEPADMISNIQRGTSAALLAAAYRSVRSMNQFTAQLTPANNEDIAAYIRSRLTP